MSERAGYPGGRVRKHTRVLGVFTIGSPSPQGGENTYTQRENLGKPVGKKPPRKTAGTEYKRLLRLDDENGERRNTGVEQARPARSTIWRVQCYTPSSQECGKRGSPYCTWATTPDSS